MSRSRVGFVVAAGLIVAGCSSRPREFTPTLAAPAANPAEFEAAYATCRQLYVEGKLDANGRMASAAGGAAATATVAAVGTAAASSIGMYTGLAVASATVVALPFAAVAGAVGMAKIKRRKKEKAIQAAMNGCLAQSGYSVTGWDKVGKPAARRENPTPER